MPKLVKKSEEIAIPEQSSNEKVNSMQAEINQMKKMIWENAKQIARGDDVQGRTKLKSHLEAEVARLNSEISKLNK